MQLIMKTPPTHYISLMKTIHANHQLNLDHLAKITRWVPPCPYGNSMVKITQPSYPNKSTLHTGYVSHTKHVWVNQCIPSKSPYEFYSTHNPHIKSILSLNIIFATKTIYHSHYTSNSCLRHVISENFI